MSVEIENIAVVIVPQDTYTIEKDNFIDAINDIITNNISVIYVECEKLVSITSSHVSLLWEAMQLCKEQNAQLVLRNVSKGIIEVFRVLDLYEFFKFEQNSCSSGDENQTGEIALFVITPHESEFCLTVDNIAREKLKLDQHLKQTPINYNIIYEIETIFYEIATNIRRHAQLKSSDTIQFSLNQMNDSIVLHFIDNGIAFDLTKHENNFKPSQAIKDRMKNGLGILMVKKMSDSIMYKRKENKNILTITKTWSK